MPIATVLMHGLVQERAMDLMQWKRKKDFKKKEDSGRESYRGNRERKSKEEDKNCEISQITTWHVFIG